MKGLEPLFPTYQLDIGNLTIDLHCKPSPFFKMVNHLRFRFQPLLPFS